MTCCVTPSATPQELQRNVRRELAKLRLLLQQYAVLASGAQVFCSDQSGKLARSTLVAAARAEAPLVDRVGAVLGPKVAQLLQEFEAEVPQHGVRITGCVSGS